MACLKLAERGGTPEEAALAAAKAQEIIDKYKLDVSAVDFDQKQADEDREEVKDFGYADPLDRTNKWSKECLKLARTVAYFNQCVAGYMKHSTYDISIRIVGRPSDVAAVRYLYGFFKLQMNEMIERCCKGNSPTFKGQFGMGIVDAIWQKLEAQQKQTIHEVREANPLALVRVNNAVARLERRSQQALDFYRAQKQNGVYGRGRNGFSGSRTETGARALGRIEGQKIRMTGAKGSLT